jgi:fructuronate reductase
VRAVHLGLGNFHRAHQAWYTENAPDAKEWGIAAFTGRTPRAARVLSAQEAVYTLIERGAPGDRARRIEAISAAVDGADLSTLTSTLARPEVSVVTLTITEAGYRADEAHRADGERLGRDALRAAPVTAMGRLALALEQRRRAGGAPVTVVPCDNLPDNGARTRALLIDLAERLGPESAEWLAAEVGFVSTSVDRITPRTTEEDVAVATRLAGALDRAPVVTEPFADWVLSDGFRAPRPAWDAAGARIVDDLAPYENRKLWLVNGAHTLLANEGLLRGYRTVDEAMRDDALGRAVEEVWDAAAAALPPGLEVEEYRQRLRERFENHRIRHRLEQIAEDTPTKLGLRIVPVIRRERASGRDGAAGARAIAAWALRERHGGVLDVAGAIARVDEELAAEEDFVHVVGAQVAALSRAVPPR